MESMVDPTYWNNKKVLVTGHTGFKGSWLCHWLINLGAEVTGFALPPTKDQKLFELLKLDNRLNSVDGNLNDREAVQQLVKDSSPDVIFHLAAQSLVLTSFEDPLETFNTNIIGTANLLDALRTYRKSCDVIVITSDKCYLKALGIYDDTLVIIAADHGSDLKNHTRAGYMRRSHPMLLIKPINGGGNLQYSAAPTSLLDIPRTVSGALGIEAEFSGYGILDGEIPSTRKRNYYYFNWNNQGFWNADHLPELEKYEINGPAEDQGAWKKSCDLLHVENGPASC
jgi:hypothetical protein